MRETTDYIATPKLTIRKLLQCTLVPSFTRMWTNDQQISEYGLNDSCVRRVAARTGRMRQTQAALQEADSKSRRGVSGRYLSMARGKRATQARQGTVGVALFFFKQKTAYEM